MQYEFKPRVSFNRYKLSFYYKYTINKAKILRSPRTTTTREVSLIQKTH